MLKSQLIKKTIMFTEKLQILPGELVPDLDELYTDYVQELIEDPEMPSVVDLVKMYKVCGVNRISVELT